MSNRVVSLVLFFCVLSLGSSAQVSKNIKLLAHWDGEEVPFHGSSKYNDVWGFQVDGVEYGCMGSTLGTHIFELPSNNDISEVAYVPGRYQGSVVHRDFAFFDNYLYAVCDQGASSLQVIDVEDLPMSWSVVLDDTTYVKTAHNVTVDEFGEKLYVSGPAGSALKVFDLSETPENPQLIFDFVDIPEIEYVHDVYARRDTAFLSAGNQGLFIYDFSSNSTPQILSALDGYPDEGYNHAGWASGDGTMFAFADETLETRMKIVDITDMSNLEVISLFNSNLSTAFPETQTAPHNLQWVGDKIYVSHYFDGLQVFDVSDPEVPTSYGFYDTYVEDNTPWRGAWGVYVLPSERILISDRQSGFYVFKISEDPEFDSDFVVYPNPSEGLFNIHVSNESFETLELEMFDMRGREIFKEEYISLGHGLKNITLSIPHLNSGVYILKGRYNNVTAQKSIVIY